MFLINPGFRREVEGREAGLFAAMGKAGVDEARRLVHVDTGQTRDSIGFIYKQSTKTLQLYADTPWAAYLEAKYPFLVPAMKTLRGFRFNGEIRFANAVDVEGRGKKINVRLGLGRKARLLYGHQK